MVHHVILKSKLAEILKVDPSTLTRKEKGHLIPVARRTPGSLSRFYPLDDIVASLKMFRVSDAVNKVDYYSSFRGLPRAWVTTTEAAAILGVSKFTILRWCRGFSIPHFRFGTRSVRFIEEELRVWVRHQESEENAFFWAGKDRNRETFAQWCNNQATEETGNGR